MVTHGLGGSFPGSADRMALGKKPLKRTHPEHERNRQFHRESEL